MAKKGGNKSPWNIIDRIEGDKVVWIILLMLYLLSIVCMFSSTSRLLKNGLTRVDVVREQCCFVLLGLICVLVLCFFIKDIKWLRWASISGFPVSFVLLLILDLHLDLGFVRAASVNDAWRILSVGGVQVHVFEVVKVLMVMYIAWALDALKRGVLPGKFSETWKKIIYIYAPFLIIFVMVIPGSNSSALMIGAIMFLVILLGGRSFKDMGILLLAGLLIVSGSYGLYKATDGKVMARIGTGVSRLSENDDMLNVFLESPRGSRAYNDALDDIRQKYSAKIAIKEGGLFGKGPGQSTQKYKVPSVSEDYMFSFIIEEYGLFGALFVIALYVSLLARGSIIARNCGNDDYAKLTVAGLCLLISGQAFLHMFVNVGIGPMTGQTLPIVSHGISALLFFSVAFGVILSISRLAQRKIDKETREAAPLVDVKEDIQASLNELDDFESGVMYEDNL